MVDDLPGHMHGRFPSKTENPLACVLDVCLDGNTDVVVEGFPMPFANPGHISEDWLLNFKLIVGQHTLLDILQHDRFTFIVPQFKDVVEAQFYEAKLPPPFAYPYGKHGWSECWNDDMMIATKGL